MAYKTPALVGTPEEVQQPGATNVGHTATQTPTIGNVVVVVFRCNTTLSTALSAAGWTKLAESGGALTPSWCVFARRVLDSGGSPDFDSITITDSSASTNTDLSWLEFSGLDVLLDQAVPAATSGTGTSTAPSGQTPVQNSLSLALVVMSGAVSAPTANQGFTALAISTGATSRLLIAYEVNASGVASGSPTIGWTTSRTFRGQVVTIRAAAHVAGSQAAESDTANGGAIAVTQAGAQAAETDTANGGTPNASGGGVTVTGAQATETDAASAGAPAVRPAGSQAAESSTANAGAAVVRPAGSQAAETGAANAGAQRITRTGSQAAESDTPSGGVAVVRPAGTQVGESDTARTGSPTVGKAGSQAAETVTASGGTPVVRPAGSQAAETDTANAGGVGRTVAGSTAAETDTPTGGTPVVRVAGGQAVELVTANGGIFVLAPLGSQASEVSAASGGSTAIAIAGSRADELDEGRDGSTGIVSLEPVPSARTYEIPEYPRTDTIALVRRTRFIPFVDRTLNVED